MGFWDFENNDDRKLSFESFAFNNQMKFLEKDEYGIKNLLKDFELFRYRNGKISNICTIVDDFFENKAYLFDYQYQVNTGKSTATFRQTVYFVNSNELGLPIFKMKPEHFGHKIAAFLGFNDFDFEEYPDFSSEYYLKGDDEQLVRHVFSDKVLRFFSKEEGWTIEACNYYLIIYVFDTRVHKDKLTPFYDKVKQIESLFKEIKL